MLRFFTKDEDTKIIDDLVKVVDDLESLKKFLDEQGQKEMTRKTYDNLIRLAKKN